MPWRRRPDGAYYAYIGLVFLLLFVVIAIGGITIANTFSGN